MKAPNLLDIQKNNYENEIILHFLDAGNSIIYTADDLLRLHSERESLLKQFQKVEKKISELTEELEADVKIHFTDEEVEQAKERYKKQFLSEF